MYLVVIYHRKEERQEEKRIVSKILAVCYFKVYTPKYGKDSAMGLSVRAVRAYLGSPAGQQGGAKGLPALQVPVLEPSPSKRQENRQEIAFKPDFLLSCESAGRGLRTPMLANQRQIKNLLRLPIPPSPLTPGCAGSACEVETDAPGSFFIALKKKRPRENPKWIPTGSCPNPEIRAVQKPDRKLYLSLATLWRG